MTLRDGDNHELHLRGVNLGGWLMWEGWIWGGGFQSETTLLDRLTSLVGEPAVESFRTDVYSRFVSEGDLARIARLGLNTVRVPFTRRLLENDATPGVYREAGWRVLDQLLDWCEKYKVYAVLDLHGAPGGQWGSFTADPAADPALRLWNSPDSQTRTVALWKAVAARYRNRTIVAGYDLLNEPAPPNGKALVDLYRRIIAAVRDVDTHHAIFLEGADAAKDFSMFGSPLTDNQVYSFHVYTWFGDDRQRRLAGWRELAERQRVPLWNGEFGENNLPVIQSTVAMFEDPANHVSGYCFWTWKKAPNRMAGLCVFQPPETWKELMRWLSFPRLTPRPTHEAALEAMKAFVSAIEVDQCAVDPRTGAALTPRQE